MSLKSRHSHTFIQTLPINEKWRNHYLFIRKFLEYQNRLCGINIVSVLLINTEEVFQEGSNQ